MLTCIFLLILINSINLIKTGVANVFNSQCQIFIDLFQKHSNTPQTTDITTTARNNDMFLWCRDSRSYSSLSTSAKLFCRSVVPTSLSDLFKKFMPGRKNHYYHFLAYINNFSVAIFEHVWKIRSRDFKTWKLSHENHEITKTDFKKLSPKLPFASPASTSGLA